MGISFKYNNVSLSLFYSYLGTMLCCVVVKCIFLMRNSWHVEAIKIYNMWTNRKLICIWCSFASQAIFQEYIKLINWEITGDRCQLFGGAWCFCFTDRTLHRFTNQGCGVGTQKHWLRLRLLHKSSICINNGKPIRHFIATTWIIRLISRLITCI
jgi:hypothetical protein